MVKTQQHRIIIAIACRLPSQLLVNADEQLTIRAVCRSQTATQSRTCLLRCLICSLGLSCRLMLAHSRQQVKSCFLDSLVCSGLS